MIEKDLKDSEKEIKYFYSLPIKIKKEIRVRNPKHLSDIYNTMVTNSAFLQRPDKMYEFAIKGLHEIEKYSIGKNRNEDLFSAYHLAIISSIGNNNLNDLVYYLNQSKNIALELVGSREGVQTVVNFISYQLPFLINAGLYAEAEDLINFIYNSIEFNADDVLSFGANAVTHAGGSTIVDTVGGGNATITSVAGIGTLAGTITVVA